VVSPALFLSLRLRILWLVVFRSRGGRCVSRRGLSCSGGSFLLPEAGIRSRRRPILTPIFSSRFLYSCWSVTLD